MKVIDCHVHCFPDDIAGKAVDKLTNAYVITPSFDGTVQGLLRQMSAEGIEASVILPVATKASQVHDINDWSASIQSERIIAFGAIHPDYPEPAEEIDRMLAMGIRGIKLHPNWQGFRPDDPRMFQIYEAVKGRMVICFHAGDELGSWTELLSTPKALASLHKRFPDLKMVAAHMGGYRMWDEAEEYLIGTDVYLDTSACFPEDLPDERFVSLIRAHGAEKILFGSDSPCGPPIDQLERFLSLPLTDEEKELICWKNARRLLRLDE